jgi:hypothetical protein
MTILHEVTRKLSVSKRENKTQSLVYTQTNNKNSRKINFIKTTKLLNPLSRRVSKVGDTQQLKK